MASPEEGNTAGWNKLAIITKLLESIIWDLYFSLITACKPSIFTLGSAIPPIWNYPLIAVKTTHYKKGVNALVTGCTGRYLCVEVE